MSIKKIITLALTGLMIAALSSPVMAGRGGGGGRGDHMGPMDSQGTGFSKGIGFGKGLFMGGLISELNLTEEQKTSVESILTNHQEQMAAFSTQRITAEIALSAAIHANYFDENAVRQASQELAAIKEEINVLRAGVVAQINEVLTEEQLAIVDEWEAKRLENLENRLNSMQSKIDEWLESEAD